jgi:hypothetical protein
MPPTALTLPILVDSPALIAVLLVCGALLGGWASMRHTA